MDVQHFFPVKFGSKNIKRAEEKFKKQQLIDSLDHQFCLENNIILHRISYKDDKEASIKELKNRVESD